MSEFKRESRYIVIKLKDLNDTQREGLNDTLSLYDIPTRDAVVVEKDWPIYEDVYTMIEDMDQD